MKRVAALFDIHGNLPALEAVLAEIRQAGVTHVIVGGDVLPGPWPAETIDRLYRGDFVCQFIHGNGERDVIDALHDGELKRVPEPVRPAIHWVAQQIGDDRRIADWPPMTDLEIAGPGRVLFCHATPRNDSDIFTKQTPEELLLPIFEGIKADLVVCGHTHMQFDRSIGRTRVVNAGSVGMNFGASGAHWLLLGPDIEFRRTLYDLEGTAARMRATAYPAAELAAGYVTNPPTEAAMLAAFTHATFKR